MIAIDLIKESALVAKHRLKSYRWKPPEKWKKGKGVVVLVHGYGGRFASLEWMANKLNSLGLKIRVFEKYDSLEKVEKSAAKLAKMIEKIQETPIYLLTHSKGGLVAKMVLDNYEEANKKIKKVISLSTPWRGSVIGHLKVANLEEMKPDSPVVKQICKGVNCQKIISLYPMVDDRVIPNRNLILEGAENYQIEVVGHSRILEATEAWELIEKLLIKLPHGNY